MLSGGYIYQLSYDDIKTMFKNHSRDARKKGRASQGLVNSSPYTRSMGKMLDYFKSEIMHTFAFQMDTMK